MSDVERLLLELEEIVAARLDTAMQLIIHELECFDRRTNERIMRSRESIEDVFDPLRACMAEHDEAVGAIVVAHNKLAMSVDVHIEEFRKELYHSLERTKSSEEMRCSWCCRSP